MKDLKLSSQGSWITVNGRYVFKVEGYAVPDDEPLPVEGRKEVARRIVACVNALEGIPTEVLINTVGPLGAFKFVQDQRDIYRNQVEELREECRKITPLERQRDELLAALESLVLFTNPKPSNAVALNNAHQVIARAKGGAA